MPNVKGKLPPLKTDNLVMRSVDFSVPNYAVVATENAIDRWDEQTQQVVKEVLLMDGCELRNGRDQIPIVDSHNDKTVRNIFGSIRGLRINDGELGGKPEFASDEESQTIARRLAEGHITDFSITAQPLETIFVKRGDSYQTPRGNVIEGPALIHTRWQPHNASICATGADEYSTVRRSYTDLQRKVIRMDEALLAQLSAVGLPEGMTDPNQVLTWCLAKLAPAPEAEVEMMAEETQVAPVEEKPVENMAAPVEEKPAPMARSTADTLGLIKRALAADQARRDEIQAAVTNAKLDRSFADELCNSGISVADANKRIIARMATTPSGTSAGAEARVTESADDKFSNAIADGIIMRSAKHSGIKRSMFVGGDKPSAGAEDFQNMNLIRLATHVAERMGFPVQRMANPDIARAAMGNTELARRYKVQRADFTAYHTTGSFPNILLDTQNKTLLAAYEEAPYTWNIWARQGKSVEDLKVITRTRISEAGNPEEVPEGKDYPENPMSDSKEQYRLGKYGESFSVSWETIINDDLDALSRVPVSHGQAMRRLQNKKVYEVLTSNPTMGDTYSLFSSSHTSGDNTSGAAAAPSVTTINAAFVKMGKQLGLSTDAILGLIPRYLIVPLSYGATALEVVGSTSYAVANGNQGITNIYGPGGPRPITVVCEPQLESNSSTTWYMACDYTQCDTVELTFLAGEESPVIETEWNIKNDTYYNKIRQNFGVKAIDWRGLYRNS